MDISQSIVLCHQPFVADPVQHLKVSCCSLFFSCFSVSLHMIGVICYLQFYFGNCFNCSLHFNCLDMYEYFWPSQWVRQFSLQKLKFMKKKFQTTQNKVAKMQKIALTRTRSHMISHYENSLKHLLLTWTTATKFLQQWN